MASEDYVIFQHPEDQLLSDAVTITPSGEDVDYPVENLYDSNPAKPYKMGATSGNVVFDFGSAVNIDLVAIIHHNLDGELANVKIQGNTTDSWGSPPLDQTISIPDPEADGFGINPFKDLSALTNSYRYWRLNFGTANSVAIQIGEFWMGETKRSLLNNVLQGIDEDVERQLIEHVTDFGVSTIYDLGSKIKAWRMSIGCDTAAKAQVETWWDSCHGRVLPCIFILDPNINDARMVRWSDPIRTFRSEAGFSDWHTLQFGLKEVSRGLLL